MNLKNEQFEVCFQEAGGEIASFTNLDTGMQYMWQGDSAYWSGKNPSLFPIIGNTYRGVYEIEGKEYAMKNHGLIRYATCVCTTNNEHEVVMSFDSNEETLQQYPFPFHYEIVYTLEGNTLKITYYITNTGDKTMPFTFGLHPGFNCPLTADETFEDYSIHFSEEETCEQIIFDTERKTPYTVQQVQLKSIPCDYDMIEEYATLIYRKFKSKYMTLQGKEHGVRISLEDFPIVAIWTAKQGAPFICLEPWYGHGDFSDVKEDFYHREGTMCLEPNEVFTTSYTIEVF